MTIRAWAALAAGLAVAAMNGGGSASAAGLTKGAPDLKAAGALAFGPDGVLFVGDAAGGAIFALDTDDRGPASPGGEGFQVAGINEKVAALLGSEPRDIMINDMALSPASGKAYLSVSRGRGPDAAPAIVRVDRAGKLEALDLRAIPFARASLAHLPDPAPAGAPAPAPTKKARPSARSQAITDLAFLDGRVYVAGLSNEQFASRLVSIAYPFDGKEDATSVEIYHGAHGAYETRSPIRTFAPYAIKGEPHLMAAYTCTPLVKVPVHALKPGSHFKGETIAELGNMNTPLDMIAYNKGGKDYLLVANTARGVMKISTEGIDAARPITSRIDGTAGQPYEKVEALKDVVQLDGLDKDNAIILVRRPNGAMDLETVALP